MNPTSDYTMTDLAEIPVVWWYLSFLGDEGWRGACFLKAPDSLPLVVQLAWALDLNPGGEVLAVPMYSFVEVPEAWVAEWTEKLITAKDDLELADPCRYGWEPA